MDDLMHIYAWRTGEIEWRESYTPRGAIEIMSCRKDRFEIAMAAIKAHTSVSRNDRLLISGIAECATSEEAAQKVRSFANRVQRAMRCTKVAVRAASKQRAA